MEVVDHLQVALARAALAHKVVPPSLACRSSRLGVIVVPDMTASLFSSMRPSKTPLKSSPVYFTGHQANPRSSQIYRLSSVSIPVSLPSILTSNGGSGKADATWSTPGSSVSSVMFALQ